jgi:hypothetical protein
MFILFFISYTNNSLDELYSLDGNSPIYLSLFGVCRLVRTHHAVRTYENAASLDVIMILIVMIAKRFSSSSSNGN